MIDWLNMANPFQDNSTPNAFAPQGGQNTLSPLLMLSFIAPEEAARVMTQGGMRVQGRTVPDPGLLPGGTPGAAAPPEAAPTTPPAPEAAPSAPGVVNQQGAPTGGPSGLTGNASSSSVLRALGALKAIQPPALPIVQAPATPRLDSPPVYKPDASSLMALIQMMGAGGGGAMPSLAQLMGR